MTLRPVLILATLLAALVALPAQGDSGPVNTNTTHQPTNQEWLGRYYDGQQPLNVVTGGPTNPRSVLTRTPEGDVAVGQVITFDASASEARNGNLYGGDEIVSWIWDLGDGTQVNTPTVQHAYDAPGVYRVNLTVHDATGWRSQKDHTVVVGSPACGTDPIDIHIATTHDGVTETLHGVLTLPAGDGPHPTLLEYGPYNPFRRGGCDDLVRNGYAIAHVSAPGRSESTGRFDFFGGATRQGGYDTVEWLAAQPWSNGRVGMIGLSGPAVGALLTASANPPSLDAVVAKSSYSDLYRDMVVIGGIPNSNTFINAWAPLLTGQDFLYYGNTLGPDNQVLDHGAWGAWMQAQLHLHPTFDDFWADRCIACGESPKAAVLYYGNQRDLWPRSTVEIARWIAPTGGRVIANPGGHAFPDVSGWAAGRNAGDWVSGEAIQWLDAHLKDAQLVDGTADASAEVVARPDVSTFTSFGGDIGAAFNFGVWEGQDGFPASDQIAQRWFLRQQGDNPERPTYHGLSTAPPAQDELPTVMTYAPHGGVTADDTGATANQIAGMQESHEAASLVFETPALDDTLWVNGPATLSFHAALAAPDVGWTVQLNQVWPDGSSHAVSKGSLLGSHLALDEQRSVFLEDADGEQVLIRAFHPHTGEAVRTLIPGVIYRFDVEIWGVHAGFLPGHRMRVAIEAQDLGFHTNATPGMAAVVYSNAAHPSSLNLPVRESAAPSPFYD